MPYTREQRTAWAQRRAAEGLCRSCNQNAIPGESRCQKCKEKRRKNGKGSEAARLSER